MYYYFHGYGSSPKAKKAEILRKVYGDNNIIAPNFNMDSKYIVQYLDDLSNEITKKDINTTIIGSSLGGLFALYVSTIVNCKVILLNPCILPLLVVPKVNPNIPIEDIILVQNISLIAYQGYNIENVLVWVTEEDELINHELITKPYFHRGVKEYKIIEKEIANYHEFNGFEQVIKNYLLHL